MYKYDFHCHSDLSDGELSIEALLAIAVEREMSGLIITEHHYMVESTAQSIKEAKRLTTDIMPVISGAELITAANEFLVFGSRAVEHLVRTQAATLLQYFRVNGYKAECKFLKTLRMLGAGIIVCHPPHEFLENIDTYAPYIDGMEVLYRGKESQLSYAYIAAAHEYGKKTILTTDCHDDSVGLQFTETAIQLSTSDDVAAWLRGC